MTPRLAKILELVRGGVCRKPTLALMVGCSVRTMTTELQALQATGYVKSVKTDGRDWSWVPSDQVEAARAKVDERYRANKARLDRAAWDRIKASRPVVLPRGHGEEPSRRVVTVYRPIKKTAPASVWELGSGCK